MSLLLRRHQTTIPSWERTKVRSSSRRETSTRARSIRANAATSLPRSSTFSVRARLSPKQRPPTSSSPLPCFSNLLMYHPFSIRLYSSWRSTPSSPLISSHDCALLLCSRSTAGELASHGLSRAQGAPAVGRRRHHRHQLPHQGHEQQDRPLQVRSRLLLPLRYATLRYSDLLPAPWAQRRPVLLVCSPLFSSLLFSGPTPSACSARSTTSPCWARPSAT